MISFKEFAEGYKTDKIDLGYMEVFYDKYLSPLQASTLNLLEIGVQHGYSIELWRDYFFNATIHAVDKDKCSAIEKLDRVISYVTDAYSKEFYDTLPNNYFDIIIDDGPHTFDSMVIFLENYVHKLKIGGLIVVEDIIDHSWTPILVDKLKYCEIEIIKTMGKQKTERLRRKWARGLDCIVGEKII